MKNSKFYSELKEYLILFHPVMAGDENFIQERSELAQQVFIDFSREGSSIDTAIAEANITLYKDLHFSTYQLIKDIVEDEFENIFIPDREQFCRNMYAYLQPLIAQFNINDDFDRTSDYGELYNLIVGSITEKIEKDGIQ